MKTLYLICESKKDKIVLETILHRKNYRVKVKRLSDDAGSISTLAKDLEQHIKTALDSRTDGDCIIVLHDADSLSNPEDRTNHDKIERICKKYRQDVILIIAHDELEAWLLADSGLCKWLKQKPDNFDHLKQPSHKLKTWLNDAQKPRWRDANLEEILSHAAGDGDTHSKSLKAALQTLHEHDCLTDNQKRL